MSPGRGHLWRSPRARPRPCVLTDLEQHGEGVAAAGCPPALLPAAGSPKGRAGWGQSLLIPQQCHAGSPGHSQLSVPASDVPQLLSPCVPHPYPSLHSSKWVHGVEDSGIQGETEGVPDQPEQQKREEEVVKRHTPSITRVSGRHISYQPAS